MIFESPFRSVIGSCCATSAVTFTFRAGGVHDMAPSQQLISFGTTSVYQVEKPVLVS